jgi:hypothetical protein
MYKYTSELRADELGNRGPGPGASIDPGTNNIQGESSIPCIVANKK